jgi:hypothetical protein
MHTTDSERDKYKKAWAIPGYADFAPGLHELAGALKWMQPESGSSITDWGSGSGKAADALVERGFRVRMVDIATNAYRGKHGPVIEACLWELPESLEATEYGYCTDVMEHIPPERVNAVLAGIAKRTERACFFQIALYHDRFGAQVGAPLHLSVFPPDWWKERLGQHFACVDYVQVRNKNLLALCTTSAN